MKKFITWLRGLFSKAESAYDKLEDALKPIVKVAVNVVQAVKTFNESATADIIAAILAKSIKGNVDDVVIDKVRLWLKKELPKLAIKLALADTTINLKSNDEKLKAIIAALGQSENKGEKALAFAASLASYLADGKLTKEELEAAAEDYYNKFVK